MHSISFDPIVRGHFQWLRHSHLVPPICRKNQTFGAVDADENSAWFGGQIRCSEFAILLYFFWNVDTKEVVYGAMDSYTKDWPKAKKLLNYAFINNVIAIVLCFPISYFLVSRNLMKGLRNSAVLGLFSMGNDLVIEFRRKHFIQSQMTQ